MEIERDYLMRQIHQLAEGLGRLLTKESIKEFINYDLDDQEALSDKEIDDLLQLSALLDAIDRYQISESNLQAQLGLTFEQVNKYYHLEHPLPDDLYHSIEEFNQKYP